MKHYFVEYAIDGYCSWFHCLADDRDHAIEQCESAYPEASIVTIYIGVRT